MVISFYTIWNQTLITVLKFYTKYYDVIEGPQQQFDTTLHALRVLRCHGMNDTALQTIYKAVVVAKLTYAASAWWGFTSADDRRRMEAVLRHGLRAGFYQSEWPTVAQLIDLQNNDDTFFHRVLSCSNHVLHCLLPDKRSHVYQLRSRPHDCILTANDDTRNFLHRLLHCDIYWFVTLLFSYFIV